MSTFLPPFPRKLDLLWLALILAAGVFLRIPADTFTPGGALESIQWAHPNPKWTQTGFDEGLYRGYVNSLLAGGIPSYPDIVEQYIEVQKTLTGLDPAADAVPLHFLRPTSGISSSARKRSPPFKDVARSSIF